VTVLFILDVPENVTVPAAAASEFPLSVTKVGPYFAVSAPGPIVLDREASGCRHAVWYSVVAAVLAGAVTQHDKHYLRIEPQ
jgi:hypothetical protein